jgi:alcohol dehydrogenase (cytochrome c)
MTGSYDPELDLLYWAVGNPKPDYDTAVRKGDNLYTNSILALRGSTGELVWYFQFTPADEHDWDANQIPVLVDRTVGDRIEKLMLMANRNGFYYVLDRERGQFLKATPFAQQNWADGIDEHGRPIRSALPADTHKGVLVYPSNSGATSWWPPSFDPALNLMIVPTLERGMVFFPGDSDEDDSSAAFSWPEANNKPFYTAVRALDAWTGRLVWEYRRAPRLVDNDIMGLLSTKSGVVFGSDQTSFFALDTKTGAPLWSFDTGGKTRAAPVTFEVDGEQYVTIAAGHDLLSFALPKRDTKSSRR